ncbi:MAG: hypothetical protein ABI647_23805 [Gemmatimonadota bacterium]
MPVLRAIISELRARHGAPTIRAEKDPWQIIARDNVMYLVDDERRDAAYRDLLKRVGKKPADVLAARRDLLLEVCGGTSGFAVQCADKLRIAAELAEGEFDGDLRGALALPPNEAKRALMRFPGVGEPGAEKIMLFTRTHPYLALDSNGLRVLRRLGFGEVKKSYTAIYRAVQADAERTIDDDCDARMEAYVLLRRHGQEVCRRTRANRDECPVRTQCAAEPSEW